MIRKDWNNLLDRYLANASLASEEYYDLNPVQKAIIQELKKAFKRITSKHNDEDL